MIYPPVIDEVLPATVLDDQKCITIPYSLNRAQGHKDVQSKVLYAKFKHIVSGVEEIVSQQERTDQKAVFQWPSTFPTGLFYKVQLGWGSSKTEQPELYSAVGVFKLLSAKPIIEFSNSDTIKVLYNANGSGEKAYLGTLTIYANDTPVFSTGEQFFSADQQKEIISADCPLVASDTGTVQLLAQFVGITTNGFELNEQTEIITSERVTGSNIVIMANPEEGFIRIANQDVKNHTLYRSISGTGLWWPIGVLEANSTYHDFTIESDLSYKYGVNADNDEIIVPSSVQLPLEHILLRDRWRQLKIQFNPKVTNFKQVVLEQKVDTLGGVYPVFMRNGSTNYREFSIGGLISRDSDDQALFQPRLQPINGQYRDSTPDKIRASSNSSFFLEERLFREEVIQWLNNGEIKLLRSPTEGNMFVRLMNVSFTPESQLGRKLYSFTATAYEVAPYSLATLKRYNFFEPIDADIVQAWVPEGGNQEVITTKFENNVFYVQYDTNTLAPGEDII